MKKTILIFLLFSSFVMAQNINDYKITSLGEYPEVAHGIISSQQIVNGELYFFGGKPSGDPYVCSNKGHKFNLTSNTWTELSLKLPYGIADYGISCQYVNNKFFIGPGFASGDGGGGGTHNKVIKYDLGNNISVETTSFPYSRIWNTGNVLVNDKIYYLGGHTGSDITGIYEFNPNSETLTFVQNMGFPLTTINPTKISNDSIVYWVGDSYARSKSLQLLELGSKTNSVLSSLLPTNERVYFHHKWYDAINRKIYMFQSWTENPKVYVYDIAKDIISETGITLAGWYSGTPVIQDEGENSIYALKYDGPGDETNELVKIEFFDNTNVDKELDEALFIFKYDFENMDNLKIEDLSISGNHDGTIQGTSSFLSSYLSRGKAASFDGNWRFLVDNSLSSDFPMTGNWSLSFSIYLDTDSYGGNGLITRISSNSGYCGYRGFALFINNNNNIQKRAFHAYDNTYVPDSGGGDRIELPNLENSNWNRIILIHKDNGLADVYINGVKEIDNMSLNLDETTLKQMSIGGNYENLHCYGDDYANNIKFDDLAFYKDTLPESIIKSDNLLNPIGFESYQVHLPFAENFDSGIREEWQIVGEHWSFDNGVANSDVPTAYQNEYLSVGDTSWTDYTFEVDMMGTAGTDKHIKFRTQNPENYYFVHMRGPIQYNDLELGRRINDSWEVLSSKNYNVQNNVNYHLKIVVDGNKLKLYINNILELEATDDTYSSGGIALTNISGGYAPNNLVFDNVNVRGSGSNVRELIAHYSFTGNGIDESGNGNNATINGAVFTKDRFDNIDKAVYLDGINDFIKVEDFDLSKDSISLSVWINYEITSDSHVPFIDKHDELNLVLKDGKIIFYLNGVGYLSSDSLVISQEWNHIVATYNGNVMKIFLNANEIASQEYTGKIVNSEYPIYFASDLTAVPHYMKGKIDDIKIYNYPLSDQEVNQLYTENSWPIVESEITWETTLSISDLNLTKELLFGQSPNATNLLDTQLGEMPLPPTPPAGAFDARFLFDDGQSSLNDFRFDNDNYMSWKVKFQTNTSLYPITLSWQPDSLPKGNFILRDLNGNSSIAVDMKAVSFLPITDASVSGVAIEYTKAINGWEQSLELVTTDSSKKQILQFGQLEGATDSLDEDLGEYELPPLPPSDIFDVRFKLPSNYLSTLRDFRPLNKKEQDWEINIQTISSDYPITLKWNNQLFDSSTYYYLSSSLSDTSKMIEMNNISQYSLTDESIESIYILMREDKLVGVNSDISDIPNMFYLTQNYPNPFNPSTSIKFGIPQSGLVKLLVYNSLGQKVVEVVNKWLLSGSHSVSVDMSSMPSGIYFYRMTTGKFSSTRKMILIK